jgi:sporulation protein YlmC with PRC-barrel domain
VLLDLGSTVHCTDEVFGELADIVILPAERRVTHLIVVPHHHPDEARLVPLGLVATGPTSAGDGISLSCSISETDALPQVEEYAYVRLEQPPPLESDEWDVGIQDVITVPTPGWGAFQMGPVEEDGRVSVSYDRVPKGEVEVRGATEVTGADGERIGRLDGVVVDADGSISRLVLQRGHLWGRRRVEIPSGAVARFETDGVTLTLSRPDVEAVLRVR